MPLRGPDEEWLRPAIKAFGFFLEPLFVEFARMSQHLHLRAFTGRPASIGPQIAAHGVQRNLRPVQGIRNIIAQFLDEYFRDEFEPDDFYDGECSAAGGGPRQPSGGGAPR